MRSLHQLAHWADLFDAIGDTIFEAVSDEQLWRVLFCASTNLLLFVCTLGRAPAVDE